MRKRKLTFSIIEDNFEKICKDLKFSEIDEIYLSIGSLRYTAGYIINLTNEEKQNINDILLEKKNIKPIRNNYKGDIIVGGESDILVNLAKCCHPIKGDEIIGFITRNEGITVHKSNCDNIIDSDRLIDVKWNYDNDNTYNTYLNIVTTYKNFLVEFVTETTKLNIYVVSISNKQIEDEIKYKICIRIKTNDELTKIINKVNQIKDTKVL